MVNTVNSPYYQLSLNILKALGGDVSVTYPDADAIWEEIYKIYDHAGGRFDIVPLEKKLTVNGNYTYYPDNDADAFMPVSLVIDVPQKYTDEDVVMREDIAREEGYEYGYSRGQLEGREEGYEDGYSGGMTAQKEKLTTIEIKSNGTYSREDGYSEVTVSVTGGMSDNELQEMLQDAKDEGFAEGELAQKALLESVTFKNNGVYTRADGWNEVSVQVDQGPSDEELQEMLKDAMDEGYQDGYADGVDDGMEEGYQDGLERGYQNGFDNGIIEQKKLLTSITINDNGTYTREDGYNEVIVEIEPPTFVTESLNVELKENNTYTYTPTVDGYNKVNIKVDVPTSGGGDSGKPKIYNGFRLTLDSSMNWARIGDVDFSLYDWSKMNDISELFGGFTMSASTYFNDMYLNNFKENFNGHILACRNLFKRSNSANGILLNTPSFGELTKDCVDFSNMFYEHNKLASASGMGTTNTSNALTTNSMFYGCSTMTTVNLFDTSKVIDATSMFQGCTLLNDLPTFDTSSVVFAKQMFSGCSWLTTIPEMDFSKVVDITYMFSACKKLTSLPNMNFKSLHEFSTSSQSWLSNTTALTSIGVIDCDSITNINYMFGSSENKSITTLGGLRNLGKQVQVNNTNTAYGFAYVPNLTKDSLLNVFNSLYDRASVDYPILTLRLHANHLALLSEEDIAIATNKGWAIA